MAQVKVWTNLLANTNVYVPKQFFLFGGNLEWVKYTTLNVSSFKQ